MNNEKIYKVIILVVFSISAIYLIHYVLFTDFRKLIFITPDDASYYLKIAENYAAGKGFTFDGMHQTNGFQPLWQYLMIPVSYLPYSPESMIRVVFLIQIILLCIASVVFYYAQTRFFSAKYILPGSLLFIIFVFFKAVNGMETALLIFLMSVFYLYCTRLDLLTSSNKMHHFFAGIILGIIVLCRLDMIFLALTFGVFMVCRILIRKDGRRENISSLIVMTTGCAVIVFPNLLYNYLAFGNIIPISGYLKSSFPRITMSDKFFFMFGYRELLFVLFALTYTLWFVFRIKVLRSADTRLSFYSFYMGIFSVYVLMYFSYTVLFMNWVIFSWYFITYSLFASLIIPLPAYYYFKRNRIISANVQYILLCSFIIIYGVLKTYKLFEQNYFIAGNNWNIESYEAAKWAETNTNSKAVFAMTDAGHFSYFSGRNVINLDGLVNNFEYQEVLKEKKLNEYLKENNVKYIVTHAIWDRDDITDGTYDSLHLNIPSHKYSGESDPIILWKKNEVYRSAPYFDGKYRVAFIVWKITEN